MQHMRPHLCRAALRLVAGAAIATLAGTATAQQPRQPPQPQPPPPPPQQQQQAPPRIQVVQLDQATLDRWLIVFAEVAPQTAGDQQLPEDRIQAIYNAACRKAAFADVNQCIAVDDYVGALLAGASEDGSKFADPVARARQDLAALNADRRIPAKDKAQQRAEIEGFIASLPERIPEAHIALLNKNAKRINDVLAKLPRPQGAPAGQGGPPPGPPPAPAPGQRR